MRAPNADALVTKALDSGFNNDKTDATTVSVSFDEASNEDELETLSQVFESSLVKVVSRSQISCSDRLILDPECV